MKIYDIARLQKAVVIMLRVRRENQRRSARVILVGHCMDSQVNDLKVRKGRMSKCEFRRAVADL